MPGLAEWKVVGLLALVAGMPAIIFLAWWPGSYTDLPDAEGRLIFRYGLVPRLFAGVMLLGPMYGLPYHEMYFPSMNESELIGRIGTAAVLTCPLAPVIWELLWRTLVLGTDGLTCHSPWRGRMFIAWQDVREVVWVAEGAYFILKGRDRWFRVSLLFVGLSRLLKELELRIGLEKMQGALPGYEIAGRTPPDDRPIPRVGGLDMRRWNEPRREGPDIQPARDEYRDTPPRPEYGEDRSNGDDKR
jgi:hypothetical protein